MLSRIAARRRLLILGAVIVVAGLIAASDAMHSRSEEILALASQSISAHPALGIAVFVLLAMVSAMLAFFSSAILVPVGVYAWGAVTCTLLLWVGWLMGGVVAFWIGRYLGRSVAASMAGESRLASIEESLGRHAQFRHILLFQLSVPSEIPGYVLGALRYRFASFLAALALAELPYALGTVYLGAIFLQRQALILVLLGIGLAVIGLVAYRVYRDLR
jgi:uncharacterized membrane protein YdjX (TVP38/TMEM64 family)